MGKFSLFKAKKDTSPGTEYGCNPTGCNECGCNETSTNMNFSEEFADEILFDNYTKGVSFLTLGDKVRVTYNGLLAKSGAQDVYAVIGYGDNSNWQNTKTYLMNNTNQQIFELSIPAEEGEQLNVVFKDKADNWDNNSGKNYSFYIH